MNNFAFLVIVAVIGGIAVVLQSQSVGIMDRYLGSLESVFITYASGGVLVAVILLARGGGNIGAWREMPWFALMAGVFGLVIIGTLGYTVSRLGLVMTYTIIVATQFTFGALVDHYGLLGADVRPFDLTRLLGVGVLMLGVWLIIR